MRASGLLLTALTIVALSGCSGEPVSPTSSPSNAATQPVEFTSAPSGSAVASSVLELVAPASVHAGETFTLAAHEGTDIRQRSASAIGERAEWVLVAASFESSGETTAPRALKGGAIEDVLLPPTRSLELAFDVTTTPGTYELCVAASPTGADSSELVCISIRVTT